MKIQVAHPANETFSSKDKLLLVNILQNPKLQCDCLLIIFHGSGHADFFQMTVTVYTYYISIHHVITNSNCMNKFDGCHGNCVVQDAEMMNYACANLYRALRKIRRFGVLTNSILQHNSDYSAVSCKNVPS